MASNSIHGVSAYMNFSYELHFTILIATIPFIYICPTMFVMWKVYKGYRTLPFNLTKLTLNGYLFNLLMLYFLANILFFFVDYLRFNLPSTGLITSWCAKLPSNYEFILLSVVADYLNYSIIICPFLVSLVRLSILNYDSKNHKVHSVVMQWIVCPTFVIFPLACTGFLFTSEGYCRQLGAPFPFGAIDIYHRNGTFPLHNSYFILILSLSCWFLSAILSSYMAFKLRTGIIFRASSSTRKLAKRAEFSISVTLITAIVPFCTNSIVSVTTIWFPENMFYFTILRTIGNDFETVMMPWILYLTHPIFRERSESPNRAKVIHVTRMSVKCLT